MSESPVKKATFVFASETCTTSGNSSRSGFLATAGRRRSASKPMRSPAMVKGERGEMAFPPSSPRKARNCIAEPMRIPASKTLGLFKEEKMVFLSQGRPFFRTSAARKARIIRSKFTLVGQFVMHDLQTRQLKSML